MNSRKLLFPLAIFFLLAVAYPLAYAEEQVERIVFDNVTETLAFFESCSGVEGILTITYDGFLETVSDDQGRFQSTRVRIGNFTFDLSSGVTYTGSFFDQFSVSSNRLTNPDQTITEVTLILMGTGSDGSVLNFRSIEHETTNPTGFENDVEYLWCAGERIGG